ncbi:hypothetical protein [Spirilliplanes yamanashiensis]|uniref:Uncharacterized protein n=1 Tax=Spirilliplanes yamanashiensis TaxID=42233 RepID=A0A8J4DJ25_9ACTN|nr:hypothetical protein [Spirilliplanes yamanashiensis]GIJ03717.1 hypothetical protein Sya03_30690 [Spirilliplanes yamanashiensis]
MSLTRRQLSLFGVEAADPSPLDLAGLLFAPGRLTRMGGTARIAVTVDAAWRVHVLAAELRHRGIEITWKPVRLDAPDPEPPPPDAAADPADPPPAADDDPPVEFVEPDGYVVGVARAADPEEPAAPADGTAAGGGGPVGSDPAAGGGPVDGGAAVAGAPGADSGGPGIAAEATGPRVGFEVLTSYSTMLAPVVALHRPAWLSGARLRLWVAAAGTVEPGGVVLDLDPGADLDQVEGALARVGLAPALIKERRAFRISGRRRLARLAELVGERPAAAPEGAWPTTPE